MQVIGWKIYYSDGSTYSSKEGRWQEAPSEGVEVVIVYFDAIIADGKNFCLRRYGGDYYWRVETVKGPIFGMGYEGYPFMPKDEDLGIVKKGKLIETELFNRIYADAELDEVWEKA